MTNDFSIILLIFMVKLTTKIYIGFGFGFGPHLTDRGQTSIEIRIITKNLENFILFMASLIASLSVSTFHINF